MNLLVFVLRRALSLIPIGLGVVVLIALMVHVIPGNPVDQILGDYATPEAREKMTIQLGLDQPILKQVFNYVSNLLQGDLGRSLITQKDIGTLIGNRILPTMQLALAAILVSIFLSIPLGVISAAFAGRAFDYLAMLFALIGVAMPSFWLGSMLVLFFSLWLDWLPVSGIGSWQNLVLPALTMGTSLASILTRMTRNSMLECMKEDYVRTARAKGLSARVVLLKHVLRNASLPLVTIVGLQFGVILTGAVITEVIYDWPGLGTLILEAVQSRDVPLIQGCVLFFSGVYLFVNLATDLVYSLVDPRIKVNGGV